jgi:hypothetical protein
VSDSGTERMKDVQRAFKVVAEFSENCPDSEEADDPSPILSCDKCMAKLIANAISERRAEAAEELR